MSALRDLEVFYALLRAGLWEQDVQLLTYGEIDFKIVARVAEEQSVVGLIAAGLEHVKDYKVPRDHSLKFAGKALQMEQRNEAMNHFIASFIGRMRKAGIYVILLKGQEVAQCYEKPLWRSSGDVDLFLSDDNYDKAKKFLLPLASKMEKEYEREKHLGLTIDGWQVELHGRLYCGLSSRIEKELDRVYQDTFYGSSVRSWDNNGTQVFLLQSGNDVFYVFTHLLQHFYKEGVGLRQICDWCRLMWMYRDTIDVGLLEKRIRRAGIMNEWKAFGVFAVDYLGMPEKALPFYSHNTKWKKKAMRIMWFVIRVGNMGHNRDASYYNKYPYFVRKCFSMGRRIGDLIDHARIFPLESLSYFPNIMLNGLTSAIRGE